MIIDHNILFIAIEQSFIRFIGWKDVYCHYKSTFEANIKNSGKYYNFTAFKGQKFIFSNKEGDGEWGATFKTTIIFFLGHFL